MATSPSPSMLCAITLALSIPLTASTVEARSLQRGVATWYGPGFAGKHSKWRALRSAGHDGGASHAPFGTRVAVTNERTGRSVIVRINDRGPFGRGLVIDLSKSSAQAIGMIGSAPVSKANREYALCCAKAAYEAGARWVVLCDTNGGTLPHEVEHIVGGVAAAIPGDHLGIHTHDDAGCAVANTLAAVRAGARHIQGTLNGLGERCGNANLVTLPPTLKLKGEYANRFEVGVSDEALGALTQTSRAFDEILNRGAWNHAPYVGASAFTTKAGIHASAVLKDPRTYEHVEPQSIGNARRLLVSDQGGRSNVLAELDRVGIRLDRNDQRIGRLLEEVKDKEAQGYAYEGADASFFLLAKRILGEVPEFFVVERFSVNVERRWNAVGSLVTVAEAIVKVRVGHDELISAAEGNGPVNALDLALRKDLGKYQKLIAGLELVDYKVRIFQGGSDAVTRVLIESGDEKGDRWVTIGVSPNIIDASFQALTDSIVYKLVKSGAKA